MNPLFERKLFLTRYVVLCVLFSAAYATVFGLLTPVPAGYAVLDGVVFALISGLEGLGLWSVLRYGADTTGRLPLRAVYYLMVGILFTGVAIGIGCAVMTVLPEAEFRLFVRTIPARSLVLVLVYVLFALYYAYAAPSDDDQGIEVANPGLPKADALERITIRGGQKIKVIAIDEIVYLQAEGDYVAIVTDEGRFLKEQTMKYFGENLPAGDFVRVHRSYIVSVGHISRIEQSGREHSVVLRNGARIRISDAGYKLLRSVLEL